MGQDNKELIKVIDQSVHELRQGIDEHYCLVRRLLEGKICEGDARQLIDLCPQRNREMRLKEAVREAIDVLEESRKAFKSKQLEVLRKRLTQVLIDIN